MPENNKTDRVILRLREVANDLSGFPMEDLRPDVSFVELGFDSLFLTQLTTAYQKAFGVKVTFRQLFDQLPTMTALGTFIASQLPDEPAAAPGPKPQPVEVRAPAMAPAPLAPTVSVPAPAPQAVAIPRVPVPVFATPASNGAPLGDGIEAVILRQLNLMTEQLRFLQGAGLDGTVAAASVSRLADVAIAATSVPVPPPAALAAVAQPAQMIPDATSNGAASNGAARTAKPQGAFGPGQVTRGQLQQLPANQQQHLENLIARYTKKTKGSKERTQRYRRPLADPRTAAGFNRRWKEMVYPIWVERSSGSKLWDVDGNEYIDLLNGFGPNFFGHSPEFVTKAMEEQLKRGIEVGPQTPLVGEVAEMICQLTGMDRASFTCSGSEAVQAAMRLSRTVTGRDKVVLFTRDYHGNFDQVLVRDGNREGKLRTFPSAPGIPMQSVDDTYVLEYGTPESLRIIEQYADEIAAVMVEPIQSRRPEFQPREFLHELRRITSDKGIVLVFDEVVTGFRIAPGGAQAYYGIQADVATYGKVVGGGMPIGIVAGRGAIMDIFDGGFWEYGNDSFPEAGVTFFAGTFVRHPLVMAAAHASLKYLIKEGPALQERVATKAAYLAERLRALFAKYQLDIELPQFSSVMFLRNKEHSELAALLHYHLRNRGLHITEGFPCYMTDSHSQADLDCVVQAFTDSVESMVEVGIFGRSENLPKDRTDATKDSAVVSASAPPPMPAWIASASEHPTSEAQRQMWFAAQMNPEASIANNGSNVVELTGNMDAPALERAIATVINRHEGLRCTFSADGTKILVKAHQPFELKRHDLSSLTEADRTAKVSEILEQDGRQVFDLTNGPLASFQLVKLSLNHHLLVFTAQMIVCDGWGFKVVLEEVAALYSAFVEVREPALEPVRQMREYAEWQTQESGITKIKESEDFWLAQYATPPAALELPSSGPRPPIRSYKADRVNLRLDPQFYQDLKRVAKEVRNTPFAFLLAAYQTWLYRLSNSTDFVVGVPFAGQAALELNAIVGQCVHTLPFRAKMDGSGTFLDHLTNARNQILDAQEYWDANFGAIVQKLDLPSDPSRVPLASVMFNLDPPVSALKFSGCESSMTAGPRFYFHYDLGFNVVDEGSTLLVECDYNLSLFDANTIRAWLDSFQVMLRGMLANPKQTISKLPVVSEAEQLRRAGVNAASYRDMPGGQTVDALIAAQVARTPNAIAVEFRDQRLTYAELDQRANLLGNYLRAHGVAPNAVVAVCLERSLDMPVGLLGVLKAGAAFAPIDPEWPAERIARILVDTKPAVLLTHSSLQPLVARDTDIPILCLDCDWVHIKARADVSAPQSAGQGELAYVLYTSGSSGRPKGVEVPHKALVNFLLSMALEPGLGPDDVVLGLTTLSFDIANLELFLPLIVGARVVIIGPEVLLDPEDFDQVMKRHRVTLLQATPTTFRMLMDHGWSGDRGLKVLCGGEPLNPTLATQLLQRCGQLWNMYGPTETTVWSTVWQVQSGQPIVIGHPIANTQIHIVDDRLEPVPVGVPGELLIGGLGIAREYRNLPDLTAEKFISDPFRAGQVARVFRTGDIARYRPDGQIEIVGRQDRQVKLRGHRIELGEIESILLSHAQVREALVALQEDTPGQPRLVAYIASVGAAREGGAKGLPSELRQLLRGKLPAYMIPSAFALVDHLPCTIGGKLDRNDIPSNVSLELVEDEYVAPRGDVEERMARLWCETLQIERISIHANFFDLGGQSILAVSLFAKMEKEFGKKLPLAALLAHPTIADLAGLLSDNAGVSWSSLVPIQKKGSKPRLFLVHGAGGNVLLYRALGEHFGPDYPLYGLQSQGLDGQSAPLHTIEEMAAFYLAEVRKIQPKGPYYLGGYCLGGTVAYEMAQILRDDGEDVPLVAMLDTYNFSRALKVSMTSFLLQKVRFHLANLLQLRPREMYRYLQEKIRQALGGELAHLKTSMPGAATEGVGRATSGTEAAVQSINDYAAEAYVPRPYPGEIALFKPRVNYKFYPDANMGWGELAMGGLDIVEVAVNPHSMLLEPYVRTLAAELKKRIDTASSTRAVLRVLEQTERDDFLARAHSILERKH